MRSAVRWSFAAVGAAALAAGVAARAQDAGPGDAEAKRERLVRIVNALGYKERIRAQVEPEMRRSPDFNPGTFWKSVDWKPVEDYFVGEFDSRLDGPTVKLVVEYLESDEGRRDTARKTFEAVEQQVSSVFREEFRQGSPAGDRGGFRKVMEKAFEKAFEKSLGTMPGVFTRANETAAIATLRNMASCQAQLQASGRIDCDYDGYGEYGTFLEMTGSVGVRKHLVEGRPNGCDFAVRGGLVSPAIMSASLANVDSQGIVTKAGYCYRIYLPDTASPSGFVHETGPAASAGLAGGTGMVAVDLGETTWCVYAWPVARGKSGNRVFFINQAADVLQSSNEVAQWSGPEGAPPGNSAFRGGGITGMVAVGTRGQDGDVWKVTN